MLLHQQVTAQHGKLRFNPHSSLHCGYAPHWHVLPPRQCAPGESGTYSNKLVGLFRIAILVLVLGVDVRCHLAQPAPDAVVAAAVVEDLDIVAPRAQWYQCAGYQCTGTSARSSGFAVASVKSELGAGCARQPV